MQTPIDTFLNTKIFSSSSQSFYPHNIHLLYLPRELISQTPLINKKFKFGKLYYKKKCKQIITYQLNQQLNGRNKKTLMKFQQVIPTLEFVKIIRKKLRLLEIYMALMLGVDLPNFEAIKYLTKYLMTLLVSYLKERVLLLSWRYVVSSLQAP